MNGKLIASINNVTSTIEEITSVHDQLSELYQNVKEIRMAEVHKTIRNLFTEFSGINELKENIENCMIKPFEYKNHEMSALNNLLKEWYAAKMQGNLVKIKLKTKKKELIEKADSDTLSKVEINAILSTDIKECHKYKEIYGYYTNKVQEEFERICHDDCITYVNKLKEFSRIQTEILVKVI